MNGPEAVKDALLDIIACAALRIRAMAGNGDGQSCALEADHIHNLPHLVKHFSRELLDYYWNVERASYLAQCAHNGVVSPEEAFRESWEKIADWMTEETRTGADQGIQTR